MFPVKLTIRDIPASEAIESILRKRAAKLERFSDKIISCHIIVEMVQKHKHQGKLFNVRIDLAVPRKELVVRRKCNEDVYIAIRDAFKALERQLEEHSRRRHGHVKSHSSVMHGHVVRKVEEEGYGFIEGVDGLEYYFSMTNVHFPDFKQLLIGDAVEYIAELESAGSQAHHVIRQRNHHAMAA